MKLCVALASAALVLAETDLKPPVCVDNSTVCSVWYWQEWVIAGRDYARNDVVGWPGDLAIPFTQQSRRAFPRWNHYHHLAQKPSVPYSFLFSPALAWPLQCHKSLYNIRIETLTFEKGSAVVELRANRPIALGDPLFLLCDSLDDEIVIDDDIVTIPPFFARLEELLEVATCLDVIEARESTISGAGRGAFSKSHFDAGDVLASSPAIHFHPIEFHSKETKEVEELLNYVYGNPNTDLLLLPMHPMVSLINHNREANVMVELDHEPSDLEEIFDDPTEFAFGEGERYKVWMRFVALREIQAGEELFIAYGGLREGYCDEAREDDSFPCRRVIGVPDSFYPSYWLEKETRRTDFPELDTRKLAPGEVQRVVYVKDGEERHLGSFQHRVGFPDGLADHLERWAKDMGIDELLRNYILGGKSLDKNGEERTRINGSNWWVHRFSKEWQSNMHYIAPDDDESTEQFYRVLSDAGFDKVLAGIGEHFGLQSLSAFYPTYIGVSHCVHAAMHSDSDYPGIFNLIFPVVQVNVTHPELVLGEDLPGKLLIPYKYEREAGILVGLNGQHGTSPTDYRGFDGQLRIVASVYMGDFSDESILQNFVKEWVDPPYPNYFPGQLRHALSTRVHWSKNDPSASLRNTIPRLNFPTLREKDIKRSYQQRRSNDNSRYSFS
jgi:hypothetical protein